MDTGPVPSRTRVAPDELLSRGTASDFLFVAGRLRREINKQQWRRLRQRRSAFLAALIRAIERGLGEHYSHRERHGRYWRFFCLADELVEAVRIHVPVQRSVQDFSEPFGVEVLAPDLLDEGEFEEWSALIRRGPVRPQKKAVGDEQTP